MLDLKACNSCFCCYRETVQAISNAFIFDLLVSVRCMSASTPAVTMAGRGDDAAHILPHWRSRAPLVDKENIDPAGPNVRAMPWTHTLVGNSSTPADESGSECPDSSCKTPGGWRKTPSKFTRKPLGDITPLFKRSKVSCQSDTRGLSLFFTASRHMCASHPRPHHLSCF